MKFANRKLRCKFRVGAIQMGEENYSRVVHKPFLEFLQALCYTAETFDKRRWIFYNNSNLLIFPVVI